MEIWSNKALGGGGSYQTMTAGSNPGVTSNYNTPPLPGAGQGYGGSDPHWTPEQQQAYANAQTDAEKAAIGAAAWQNYDQRRATSNAIRASYSARGGGSGSGYRQAQYNPYTGTYSVQKDDGTWEDNVAPGQLQTKLGDAYNSRPAWEWQQQEDQANAQIQNRPQFDPVSGSWSVYDPTTKQWKGGITKDNLTANLPTSLRQQTPDWVWTQQAEETTRQHQRLNDYNAQEASQYGMMQSPTTRYVQSTSF